MSESWQSTDPSTALGLYVHIPYCRALCHYCDFAKTANFEASHIEAYAARLTEHLGQWLDWLERWAPGRRLTSVFFGGGTPSLLTREYRPLMALLAPHLAPDTELTLEANPDDLSEGALAMWRALGFIRLLVGVQTFDPQGLAFLRRLHDSAGAGAALERGMRHFPNLNADLIYGWPGQTLGGWREDLDRLTSLGVPHLSLYTLTFEARTPIGRAHARGRLPVPPPQDEWLADAYGLARERLAGQGFVHDEVSNWARSGHSCRHNWLYWREASWLAIGAGAHGYWREPHGPGVRWAYPGDDRRWLRGPGGAGAGSGREFDQGGFEGGGRGQREALLALISAQGGVVETDRGGLDWLTEYVGSTLRCLAGTSLDRIQEVVPVAWDPTPALRSALSAGIISNDVRSAGGIEAGGQPAGVLHLQPAEWFRETGWGLTILESLRPLGHPSV